jgi:hypothetical protein
LLTGPITWIFLAAVWASFLWFPYQRTARTVAYLVAVTGLYIAVGGAAESWPVIVRLAILLSIFAMHFWLGQILSALPPAVSNFRNAYIAINKRLTAAYTDYEKTQNRQALELALQRAIAALWSLELPPGGEWPEVQSAAASLVEERLTMLKDGTDADSRAALRYRTHRAEVHQRFWDALERSKRFWR